MNGKKTISETFANRENYDILERTHKIIMGIDDSVEYLIYPIYIKYLLNDKVIAVIFFKTNKPQSNPPLAKPSKGISVESDQIDLGLNVASSPEIKGFRTAEYMKDKNINYSILLSNSDTNEYIEKIVSLL